MIIFAGALYSIIRHKRTCPRCKRSQITQSRRSAKQSRCKYCGAEIPPAKKAATRYPRRHR